MLPMLALSGVAVGAMCAAVVVVTVVMWHASRPPVVATMTLPPVMRRGVLWWLGGTLFFAFAAGVWLVVRTPLGLPRHGVYRFVPLALGLVPLLVLNPLYLWRTAWVRRSLEAADGRLCTHCAYDVSGLEPAGTCPECGGAYDAEADAQLWAGLRKRAAEETETGRSVSG